MISHCDPWFACVSFGKKYTKANVAMSIIALCDLNRVAEFRFKYIILQTSGCRGAKASLKFRTPAGGGGFR